MWFGFQQPFVGRSVASRNKERLRRRLLVAEFIEKPTSTRFDHVIIPLQNGLTAVDYLRPILFIWYPVAHYNVEMKCPLHNCPLKPGMFTDEVQKNSPRNPQLVYGL